MCNNNLRVPKFTDEMIDTEINDYIEDWGSLDCNELLDQIKQTYRDKFIIDDNYILEKCRQHTGGTRRKIRNKRKTIKKKHRVTKKRNKYNKKQKQSYRQKIH